MGRGGVGDAVGKGERGERRNGGKGTSHLNPESWAAYIGRSRRWLEHLGSRRGHHSPRQQGGVLWLPPTMLLWQGNHLIAQWGSDCVCRMQWAGAIKLQLSTWIHPCCWNIRPTKHLRMARVIPINTVRRAVMCVMNVTFRITRNGKVLFLHSATPATRKTQ